MRISVLCHIKMTYSNIFFVIFSYSSDDEASNMAIIDFRLQSGYTADKASLDLLKNTNQLLKRYEVDGKSVIFYFDKVSPCLDCHFGENEMNPQWEIYEAGYILGWCFFS